MCPTFFRMAEKKAWVSQLFTTKQNVKRRVYNEESSFFMALATLSTGAGAASFGWAVPISMLQEANVLHVEFAATAARSGLPSCASRTYIDLTTDAGKVRASLALTAFAAGKEVFFSMSDDIVGCQWSSSVPNNWLKVRN